MAPRKAIFRIDIAPFLSRDTAHVNSSPAVIHNSHAIAIQRPSFGHFTERPYQPIDVGGGGGGGKTRVMAVPAPSALN